MILLGYIRKLRPQGKLALKLERDMNPESPNTKICLPGAEVAGVINWYKHINGNFDEFLESECGSAPT